MRIQKRYGPLNIYAGTAPPAKNKAQGYKKSKKKKKKKRTTPAASFIKAYPNATLHEKANNLIQNFQNMDAPSRHKFYKNSLSQPADWQVTPKKYKPKVGANSQHMILNSGLQLEELLKIKQQLDSLMDMQVDEYNWLRTTEAKNAEEEEAFEKRIEELDQEFIKIGDRRDQIKEEIDNFKNQTVFQI